jgi:hypothetical protein
MKDKKKYASSPVGFVVLFLFAILVFLVSLESPEQPQPWITNIYVVVLLVIAIDLKFGIYATLTDGTFYERKHFFYGRRIEVSEISKIRYMPTWMFGERMRSIYVFDKNHRAPIIRMANAAYPQETLAQVVSDLKRRNPSIELDTFAMELVDRFHK